MDFSWQNPATLNEAYFNRWFKSHANERRSQRIYCDEINYARYTDCFMVDIQIVHGMNMSWLALQNH